MHPLIEEEALGPRVVEAALLTLKQQLLDPRALLRRQIAYLPTRHAATLIRIALLYLEAVQTIHHLI